jgi:hypothetical protein
MGHAFAAAVALVGASSFWAVRGCARKKLLGG